MLAKLSTICVFMMAATVMAGDHDHDHEHGHGGDVEVGVNAANAIELEFDADVAAELPPVNGPLLFGCSLDDPGFFAIEEDEPEEGLFAIPAGVEIVFTLVSLDPGLRIFSPGFGTELTSPGDSFSLGAVPFDTHPTWLIDETHPAFDEEGVFSATFNLSAPGGEVDPSENVTMLLGCAHPGACCLPTGECEDGEFEGACEAEGGIFLGEDTTCTENACTTVPTVSTWGLVVLALMLVAGAKLYGTRFTAAA
ncbi:MAG: hypothetical protein ACPGXK_10100 [Phycisphaerae bacterium]